MAISVSNSETIVRIPVNPGDVVEALKFHFVAPSAGSFGEKAASPHYQAEMISKNNYERLIYDMGALSRIASGGVTIDIETWPATPGSARARPIAPPNRRSALILRFGPV